MSSSQPIAAMAAFCSGVSSRSISWRSQSSGISLDSVSLATPLKKAPNALSKRSKCASSLTRVVRDRK